MSTETLRRQGTDACHTYFIEHAAHLTELCAYGQGDTVMKALVVMANSSAAEAVGILDAARMQTYAEGYLEQAISEIEALRGTLPIRLP